MREMSMQIVEEKEFIETHLINILPMNNYD